MRVAATDFLPYEDQLFIAIADHLGNIHMLEYKPERAFSSLLNLAMTKANRAFRSTITGWPASDTQSSDSLRPRCGFIEACSLRSAVCLSTTSRP